MNKVTFTKAFYRNKAVVGTFDLVQGFTPWAGDARRVGTKGPGYVKVAATGTLEGGNRGKTVKVTVTSEGEGYTIATDATDEIAGLEAQIAELVGPANAKERSKLRKRLARRKAKVVA